MHRSKVRWANLAYVVGSTAKPVPERRFGSAAGNVRHHIYYNADKPGGVRLDLLDNTGDRFDYFRFDKSSGLIASEALLRLVWRVRTVGALARQSRSDRFAHVLWRSRCAPR